MAISKLILNGEVQMDVTSDTVTAGSMLSGTTATKNDGTKITGEYPDVPVFSLYWDGTTWDSTISCNKTYSECLALYNNSSPLKACTLKEYIDGQFQVLYGGSVFLDDTTLVYTSFGEGAEAYGEVRYNSNNTLEFIQPASVLTSGYFTAPGYYYAGTHKAFNAVNVDIPTKTSSNLTVSGATVMAPAGYYASAASKSVASGTAGTPSATKGSVSNHAVSVTPSVTNTTGYITGGTKTGTAVSVSASELVSGNLPITENGNNINVANYATVSVDVSSSGGSSYVLHSSNLEITANVTSTSATILSESLKCDSSAINESTMIFVKIRDKAGKRNGYFYGSDTIFTCVGSGTSGWAQSYRSTRVYRYNDNHVYTHTLGTTTGYGVYVSSIDGAGALTVQGRYSSSYSLTINGTYSIEVYTLEWPNNEPPYNNDAAG